jgi:hypothetical protein
VRARDVRGGYDDAQLRVDIARAQQQRRRGPAGDCGTFRPIRAAAEPSVGEAQRPRSRPCARGRCEGTALAGLTQGNRRRAIRRPAPEDEVTAPVRAVAPAVPRPDVPAVVCRAEAVQAPLVTPGPAQLEARLSRPSAEDFAVAAPELDVVVRGGGNRGPAEERRPGDYRVSSRREQPKGGGSVGSREGESEQRGNNDTDYSCAPRAQPPLLPRDLTTRGF